MNPSALAFPWFLVSSVEADCFELFSFGGVLAVKGGRKEMFDGKDCFFNVQSSQPRSSYRGECIGELVL